MTRIGSGFLAILGFFAFAATPAAHASLLLPGDSAYAISVAAPTGATLVDSLNSPFTSLTASGQLTTQVFTNDSANPYGADKLTFAYRIQNTDSDGLPTGIFQVAVSDFQGWLTDVGYVSPLAGEMQPYIVQRDLALAGPYVAFSFISAPIGPGVVAPGMSSSLLIIRTNATDYRHSLASVSELQATNLVTLSPVAVPEPASMSVLALAGLLLRRRR